ncbi:MAG TPA: cell wall metabolism sensor histidine kinase WalK [Tissierellia bacterium]|jgi:signal transduction histidine kinase|nr:cell wall metabolism sensor histidine kinase WalK [Tissierellia bacterium]
MKNKIAVKLTLYFSAALLIFSIVIGGIFMNLFRKNAIEIHKKELERRALTIASTISELLGGYRLNLGRGMGGMGMNMHGGMGPYIRNLNTIAMADAWIVDEDLNILTTGTMAHRHYKYADLPSDAELVVKDVFKGETTFSEGFSQLLEVPTLTIGTPIKIGGEIVGALLIHSPVKNMDDAIDSGFKILIFSIAIALILSLILSWILALTFTEPLKKMKKTAIVLAGGDYDAKTGVKQNDEIGDLAATMDLLSQRLKEASKEREKLNKQRQDFITNISHELRTPVTVIRGSLEALSDEIITEPEEVKEYHKQVLNESKNLERLINDLLELSRLENVDFKIEKEVLNLVDVLNDALRSASNMARMKNIILNYRGNKELFTYEGDYGRLRQMFLIVLDNAIKYSPENSSVYIILKDNKIIIEDEGEGISKEDLPYVFDRYYRVKSPENKTGTGLGLTIAKQIALRHGIDLYVESQENKGSKFIFDFKTS